jgi:hypothetical protein
MWRPDGQRNVAKVRFVEGRKAAITTLGGRPESLLVETAISYVRETTMNWAVLSRQPRKKRPPDGGLSPVKDRH